MNEGDRRHTRALLCESESWNTSYDEVFVEICGLLNTCCEQTCGNHFWVQGCRFGVFPDIGLSRRIDINTNVVGAQTTPLPGVADASAATCQRLRSRKHNWKQIVHLVRAQPPFLIKTSVGQPSLNWRKMPLS